MLDLNEFRSDFCQLTWKQFLANWSLDGAASRATDASREEKSRLDEKDGREDKATSWMYSEAYDTH